MALFRKKTHDTGIQLRPWKIKTNNIYVKSLQPRDWKNQCINYSSIVNGFLIILYACTELSLWSQHVHPSFQIKWAFGRHVFYLAIGNANEHVKWIHIGSSMCPGYHRVATTPLGFFGRAELFVKSKGQTQHIQSASQPQTVSVPGKP